MFKKLLVPLDGSKTAEYVLPYVRALAAKLQLPVELFGVIDRVELAHGLAAVERFYMDNLLKQESARCAAYLALVAESFTGARCATRLEQGSAAESIIDAAALDKDTLIMMATHGRAGFDRWLLGSVAEKVLRGTANPLLLIRAGQGGGAESQARLSSVVVALDGSELAERILPTIEELAQRLDLAVVLFRAYAIPYGAYTTGDGFYERHTIESFIARLRDEAVEYLEKKSAELKGKGLEKVSFIAKEGLSADEIIAFARQTADSLIAMSTHGYSGVKRWALGSVTETVVRHGRGPVLVLRAVE